MSIIKQKKSSKTLKESVKSALDQYFKDMNGHQPDDLYRMVISEVEEPLLETVITFAEGNQTRAAEILGINRTTLRKKLKEHNLDK